MARNYIDIPILIVKLKSVTAFTAGNLLKGTTTAGWDDATGIDACCGAYAVATADTCQYKSVMLVGTFWASAVDTMQAGVGFRWSAADGAIDVNADSGSYCMGTVIDPVDSGTNGTGTTTRATRALIYGTPINVATWNA